MAGRGVRAGAGTVAAKGVSRAQGVGSTTGLSPWPLDANNAQHPRKHMNMASNDNNDTSIDGLGTLSEDELTQVVGGSKSYHSQPAKKPAHKPVKQIKPVKQSYGYKKHYGY
jgi:hypothetical protein